MYCWDPSPSECGVLAQDSVHYCVPYVIFPRWAFGSREQRVISPSSHEQRITSAHVSRSKYHCYGPHSSF